MNFIHNKIQFLGFQRSRNSVNIIIPESGTRFGLVQEK